ncbi:MAG TPA: signal peptidase II, partial [Arthrobacter sp.]|nr:signal peptidase II [Arthrobacter sp.]
MTDAPSPDAMQPADAGHPVGRSAGGAPPAPARRRRAMLLSLFAAFAAFAYVFDQLTKLWVTSTMVEGERIPVLPPLLHWYYIRNSGAA